jgi:hypothetical protein
MALSAPSADGGTTFDAKRRLSMLGQFPQPRFMPCPECGGSVARAELDEHVCDQNRWLDYKMFQQRDEVESFESELGGYLASARGRFELWYAEHRRRTQR